MANRKPRTVAEALELLLKRLSLKDKTTIANMSAGELPLLNDTVGEYIRNNFDLMEPDSPLMKSCRFTSGRLLLSETEASAIILRELAYKLDQTHKLRIVK